jgi:arylformamidase
MDERPIIDISQPIAPGIGVWPGDTAFQWEFTWSMAQGDSCNVSRVTTSPHVGTHADAPVHFLPQAAGIGEVDLHRYVGACWVVDGPREGEVLPEHFAQVDLERYPRLLVRTRDDDDIGFPDRFVSLAPSAAGALRDRGAVLIGLDTPSMDHFDSKDLPSHQTLLPASIAILENLQLAHVAPGAYELLALPLRWIGLDASPVRAVLRPL